MQLRTISTWTLGALLVACGPNVEESGDGESWMQGWFSLLHPSDAPILTADSQFFLGPEGEAVFRSVGECGSTESTSPMEWTRVDSSTVRLVGENSQYLLKKLSGCDEFERVVILDDGTESSVDPMHAGQICLTRGSEDPECVGSGCTVCRKNWCEGAEPAVSCEDD